ncbi:MAG: amidohydrolase family protein [Hyphomicrobiales bacterium]|nr:amidohydrolase family protein [Hyphomicrobiales bacterium]
MKLDAHQHFWRTARADYGWLTPESGVLYRDYLPADLEPLLNTTAIDGTILVQAAPTVAETHFMLSLAAENAFIKGVVGWVDFESPSAAETVADLAAHRDLRGLRPMIQDIPDTNWMLREDLNPAFEALIEHDLAFDALTYPHHLKNLMRLLERYPDMRTIIDHGSKPQIRDGAFDSWAADMKTLAQNTSAYCKVSGLVTEAASDWTVSDLQPYVSHLLETFGPHRLVWGSDWPVCLLAASYDDWFDAAQTLIGQDETVSAAVFGGNASDFYRLAGSPRTPATVD